MELEPKQLQMIDCLLSGESISGTAKKLDVCRSYIYENMEKPAVRAEYNRRLNDIKQQSEHRIQCLYQKAVNTLEESLDAENESVRLKTALFLIDRLDKLNRLETDPKVIEHDQKQLDEIKFL